MSEESQDARMRSLSEQRSRPWFGTRVFEKDKHARAAMKEAAQALAEVKSVYKPSGEIAWSALLAMGAFIPIVALIGVIVIGIPNILYNALSNAFDNEVMSRILGFGGFFLYVFEVVGLIAMVVGLFSWLSKARKNRSPGVPAIFAVISCFFAATYLFFLAAIIWPLTLSPVDLAIGPLPLFWLLIPFGVFGAPIFAGLMTHKAIASQKFCEASGVYLDEMRAIHVHFDFIEDALALLQVEEAEMIAHLPRSGDDDHAGKLSLWWNPQAHTGFLEFEAKFKAQGHKDTVNKDWLIYSRQLDAHEAGHLNEALGLEPAAMKSEAMDQE